MNLDSARKLVNRLDFKSSTGSTNTDLVLAASDAVAWPDLSVLCAAEQTGGKGRAGRSWESLANQSLAVSILVRPKLVPTERLGWLPILAGLAMTRAVSKLLPDSEIAFKWPNDVLVNDKKISGVLTELIPTGNAVVIGAGLNLTQTSEQLPIEEATSIELEGGTVSFAAALESYLYEFVALYKEFTAHRGDAESSGLRSAAQLSCSTLARRVRAIMPDQTTIEGKAIQLDEGGRLLVAVDGEAQLHLVSAGDIVHLRHS